MIAVRKPNRHLFYFLLICLLSINLICSTPSYSFGQDTLKKPKKEHSITRATVYSAIVPGLGQAYNRKYWKIPIVYAGFGATTYFIILNTTEFKKFREAYRYVANDETYPIDNDYVDRYTLQQLEDGMNTYRRYRDLSYILTFVWYGLNILDANVDAHFFDYDISDDLSMHWAPVIQTEPAPVPKNGFPGRAGVRITLNF